MPPTADYSLRNDRSWLSLAGRLAFVAAGVWLVRRGRRAPSRARQGNSSTGRVERLEEKHAMPPSAPRRAGAEKAPPAAAPDPPPKDAAGFLQRVASEFSQDECVESAAALAYYAMFSLAPVLVIAIAIAGLFFDPQDVRGEVQNQLRDMLGPGGAEQVRTMIQSVRQSNSGVWATALSVLALLFGATGALGQLQTSLNKAWDVRPSPEEGVVKSFVGKRLLSFALILVIGFLLLVLLALSTVASALGTWFSQILPSGFSGPILMAINVGISLLVATLLFAAIFKLLPDAKIRWRDVWTGAAATAVLFVIGKFLIGLYLGSSGIGSAYGAAGSLALVLVWVYYSSLILLLGAEFTQVWTRRRGRRIDPAAGAIRAP